MPDCTSHDCIHAAYGEPPEPDGYTCGHCGWSCTYCGPDTLPHEPTRSELEDLFRPEADGEDHPMFTYHLGEVPW